jgi:hypothetical protein
MSSTEAPLHLLPEISAKFKGLDYLRSPHVSSSVYLNAVDEVASLAVSARLYIHALPLISYL